jgi:DNA-directed RNA polymerase subunit RPC12/RpoP
MDSQDDTIITVGSGMSLYACMACGHYLSSDTASTALSLLRCHCCGSSLMKRITCEQDLLTVKRWLDEQMLMEEGEWRGPMTPQSA